jgi:hypothetical protein
MMFYVFLNFFCYFIASVANNKVDEFFPGSVNSNPNPAAVFSD